MTTTPLKPVDEALLRQIAAEIRQEIPEADVRLFGSHARGEARADSDLDLLVTVRNDWLAHHNRSEVLDRLRSSGGHQAYANLITQLAPPAANQGLKLVRTYQFSHGPQRHPVSERPLAAKLSAALWHRGAM